MDGIKMIPYDEFDPEVVALCKAMNSLPGLYTIESCCGHGKRPFCIWFMVEEGEQRGLFIFLRSVDRRYFKFGNRWQVIVDISDEPESPLPIVYRIEGLDYGEQAYKDANAIAEEINLLLHHSEFMTTYNLTDKETNGND